MRKINNTGYRLPSGFFSWFRPEQHLQVLRYYCSPKARTFMMWQVLTVWNPDNVATRALETELQAQLPFLPRQDVLPREVCLNFVNRAHVQHTGFFMTNFMDSIGPRTHHVMAGSGCYERDDGQKLHYKVGDVLLFDEEDYGHRFQSVGEPRTTEVTCCWGEVSGKRNWELFKEYEEAKGVERNVRR